MNKVRDDYTILDILKIRSKENPSKVAYRTINEFLEEKEAVTYKDLFLDVTSLANFMIANKVKQNGNIILLIDSELKFLKSFYACMLCGARPIPVKTEITNKSFFEKIHRIISDLSAEIIVTTHAIFLAIKDTVSDTKFIIIDDAKQKSDEKIVYRATPADVAYINYTSGSTGSPKGTALSHRNLSHHAKFTEEAMNLSEDSSFVSWLPLQHTAGLNVIALQSMFCGATCTLISPEDFLKSPSIWLKAISKYKGTYTGAPNFAYDLCVENIDVAEIKEVDLSSLDIAFNASQLIKDSTIKNFTKKFSKFGFKSSAFFNAYGMTECVALIAGGRVDNLSKPISKNNRPSNLQNTFSNTEVVSCGVPVSGCNIKVMNNVTKNECKTFEIGEVVVSSPSISPGYINDVDRSSFSKYNISNNNPSYATGDLGFFDDCQNLFICGRLKDFMISRGKNIYFQDIERSLEKLQYKELSDVFTSFSIVVDGEELLIIVIECCVEVIQESAFIEMVKTINRLVLDDTGVLPSRIIFSKRNSIPRSDIGKLLRYKCKSLYENNNFPYLYKHDTSGASGDIKNININNIAESLISIISHVTGWNDITLQSEISLIGIDSLAATRISAQCKSLLKVSISMADILASNTIAELIEKIEKEREANVDNLAFFVDSQIHLDDTKRIQPSCLQKEILLAENNNQANAPNENVYFEIDVSGKFDLEIFKAAFYKLVEHQKQLCCVFVRNGNDFFQEYVSYPDSYFQIFDSAKFSKEKISKIISNEISKFFGLYDHIMRVTIIKENENYHRIIFVIHHSNFDHWSAGVFINTLFNYYERIEDKEELAIDNANFKYSDFIIAEQKWMSSSDRKSQLAYWQSALAGITPLQLHYDFLRTNIQSHSGSLLHFNIPVKECDQIKKVAKNSSTTAFTVMLSIFYVALSKYSNQSDIVVGSAISNRNSKKVEDIIGYFSNMLAIRVNLSSCKDNFFNLLRDVKNRLLEAYKNSNIPPEEIVRSINFSESLPYRTAFLMQNTPQATMSYKNFDINFAELHNKSCNFDIEVNITENEKAFDVTIEYCNEVFRQETILAFWNDYQKMIAFVIDNESGCKISEILSIS